MQALRGVGVLSLVLLFSLSYLSRVTNGSIQCRKNQNDASKFAYTITVSKSGGGNFTKVQDAVNAVPNGYNQWIRIYVDSGTYWEQVKILYGKNCIVLEGHSRDDTMIVYDAHASTDTSVTFVTWAENFLAKNIAFKNSYSFENEERNEEDRQVKQAVAISVYGDKSAFYNCAFVGFQDTLWDVSGRHYFKDSYIEGAIDFIWGDGQSIYEDCSINVTGNGYITAQGRDSHKDPGGFVFIRGSVFGSGNAYLGRAYAPYSRVIFYQTSFSNVINPLGWDPWKFRGYRFLIYAEINCTGQGANMSNRVKWERNFTTSEAAKYTTRRFIDRDNWISQQP